MNELDSIFEYIKELGFEEHVLQKDKDAFLPWRYFVFHTSQYRNCDTETLIVYHHNWLFTIMKSKQGHETGIEGFAPHVVFTGIIPGLDEAKMLLKMVGVYNSINTLNHTGKPKKLLNVFNPETGDTLIETMLKYIK